MTPSLPRPLDADLTASIASLVVEGTSLLVVVLGPDRMVVYANHAFEAAAGSPVVGLGAEAILQPASWRWLDRRLDLPTSEPVLLSFLTAAQARFSLRCRITVAAGGGYVLVGERPWADHEALEAQLWASNDQLMVLLREQTRQTRALAEATLELESAHRELRDAHWHLDKISDVLPICMACRRVRTGGGEGSWEAIESYLVRSSTFLSHGYCARCADRLEAQLPDAGAP